MTMKEYSDKERRILDTAAELFAKQPFHKVLLSDVARVAAVGKGTLYLYFQSKEDLYFAVLFRGFSSLVDHLSNYLADTDGPAEEQMAGAVRILCDHMFQKAVNMEMMSMVMTFPTTDEWRAKRLELWSSLEELIRRGIRQGVFEDPDPSLTAQYIPGMIRTACLFKARELEAGSLAEHAGRFILQGLAKRG